MYSICSMLSWFLWKVTHTSGFKINEGVYQSNSNHYVLLIIYKNMAQKSTNPLDLAWSLTALASPVGIL